MEVFVDARAIEGVLVVGDIPEFRLKKDREHRVFVRLKDIEEYYVGPLDQQKLRGRLIHANWSDMEPKLF